MIENFEINERDFLRELANLNPADRLIYILRSIIEKSEDIVGNATTLHLLSTYYEEVLKFLHRKYSLNLFEEQISYSISILNEDEGFTTILPLLLGEQSWQELIKYELSLTQKEQVKFKINYFIACLEDLSYRINYGCILDYESLLISSPISRYSSFPITDIILRKHVNVPIDNYIMFLENITSRDIQSFESNQLTSRLSYLESLLFNLKIQSPYKIILNPNYTQSDVLKFLSFFENQWTNIIDAKFFLSNYTTYNREMPGHYYLSEPSSKNPPKPLSKEEVSDLLGLIKYLIEKNVILDNKANSRRKLADLISTYFDFEVQVSIQSLRKKLSFNDKTALSKNLVVELNYFIK